jgi:hypothetical protein
LEKTIAFSSTKSLTVIQFPKKKLKELTDASNKSNSIVFIAINAKGIVESIEPDINWNQMFNVYRMTMTMTSNVRSSFNLMIKSRRYNERLTEVLTRIEERLAAVLNDPRNKTHNVEYNSSVIKIPNKDDWKIVLWHLNRDLATEYSGEKFHCSWKVAKKSFYSYL